jgi:GDP-D-mannose dehydratase
MAKKALIAWITGEDAAYLAEPLLPKDADVELLRRHR